jgi:hypothetical protein
MATNAAQEHDQHAKAVAETVTRTANQLSYSQHDLKVESAEIVIRIAQQPRQHAAAAVNTQYTADQLSHSQHDSERVDAEMATRTADELFQHATAVAEMTTRTATNAA